MNPLEKKRLRLSELGWFETNDGWVHSNLSRKPVPIDDAVKLHLNQNDDLSANLRQKHSEYARNPKRIQITALKGMLLRSYKAIQDPKDRKTVVLVPEKEMRYLLKLAKAHLSNLADEETI